ncbi:MAG: hypothetical protein ABFS34_06895 [Gemmatimonadota bacterium]
MLTRDRLVELYRSYQDRPVLSVYVDADQHDPAQRDAWRVNLKRGIRGARAALKDASREERADFDAAAEAIEEAVGGVTSFLRGRGWVGFAGPDGLIHGDRVEVPLPDLVRWESGLRIAPYMRALKQTQPVRVVILDRRKATVYRYRDGKIEEVDHARADTFIGDLTDMGVGKRAARQSGVRGQTGTDLAQTTLDRAADQLVARLASDLCPDGCTGPLILGGTPEQIAALRRALPGGGGADCVDEPSLHFDVPSARLTQLVEEAASRLSSRRSEALVAEIVERSHPGDDGCLGRDATEKALRERRVRTLAVSVGLQRRDPDLADRLIGTAIGSNGADAHLLPRDAGELLDEVGEGMGALLHYHVEPLKQTAS